VVLNERGGTAVPHRAASNTDVSPARAEAAGIRIGIIRNEENLTSGLSFLNLILALNNREDDIRERRG
jgi:hypothetical protein